MGFFDLFKSSKKKVVPAPTPPPIETPTPPPDVIYKTYRVAGVSYREKNIMDLSADNDQYTWSKKELAEDSLYGTRYTRVYKYEWSPQTVELIPEPDNPEDPNAVKVMVDNVHIGYIKAGSCRHVLKILRENRAKEITCEISGGPYKYISYDDIEDSCLIEKDTAPLFAKLTIAEKQ